MDHEKDSWWSSLGESISANDMPSIFDGPFLETEHIETPVGPLFPELYDVSDGLDGHESATMTIGAKTSRDYAHGPGINAEKDSDKDKMVASKTHTLSPDKKLWGKGKLKLSSLHAEPICRVSGVEEASECDKDKYAGEVSVKYNDRFNVLNAIGVNVAKCVDKGGGEDGTMIVPGKVVAQKHLKGRITGASYRLVYLNGEEESVNETMLRYYSSVFASASMKTENPLKPLIVRMM